MKRFLSHAIFLAIFSCTIYTPLLHGHGFSEHTLVRMAGGYWRVIKQLYDTLSHEKQSVVSYDQRLHRQAQAKIREEPVFIRALKHKNLLSISKIRLNSRKLMQRANPLTRNQKKKNQKRARMVTMGEKQAHKPQECHEKRMDLYHLKIGMEKRLNIVEDGDGLTRMGISGFQVDQMAMVARIGMFRIQKVVIKTLYQAEE